MNKLSDKEIHDQLNLLSGWSIRDGKLAKDFTFDSFKDALAFIVKVGLESELQGHHPELFNVYNKVQVRLVTHDAGGKVTEKDFNLAKAIDGVR